MPIRYVHTNIIANDWKKLSHFYQDVFGCKPVPPQRNLRGAWLDGLTGIQDVHVEGEHLALPGYSETLPTLEIFSYSVPNSDNPKFINGAGLAHLAFEVDDVPATTAAVIAAGGSQLGEIVTAQYPNNVTATFIYVRDPEGNIIELQNWRS